MKQSVLNRPRRGVAVCAWMACASAALGNAKLKTTFPLDPTPTNVTIPGGGFRGPQTFTWTSIWDNNSTEKQVNVTIRYDLTETDPGNDDEHGFKRKFTLKPGANQVKIKHFPVLSKKQLNDANDWFEGGSLEFIIEAPVFSFVKKDCEGMTRGPGCPFFPTPTGLIRATALVRYQHHWRVAVRWGSRLVHFLPCRERLRRSNPSNRHDRIGRQRGTWSVRREWKPDCRR